MSTDTLRAQQSDLLTIALAKADVLLRKDTVKSLAGTLVELAIATAAELDDEVEPDWDDEDAVEVLEAAVVLIRQRLQRAREA